MRLATPEELERQDKIAKLNDLFRTTFVGGRVVMTRGVNDLPDAERMAVLEKVRRYGQFTEDNDVYGEHDFGVVHHGGQYFWKIDYYDKNVEFGSEDPTDPNVTTRVLTIMRADEY